MCGGVGIPERRPGVLLTWRAWVEFGVVDWPAELHADGGDDDGDDAEACCDAEDDGDEGDV